jgi:hypothetical protein
MKVKYDIDKQKVPIKYWFENVEDEAWQQAINLSNHPTKDIEEVMKNEKDLVKPIVQLLPLAVVKG